MSLDITNFFKILWNDEDLNNKPTSTPSNDVPMTPIVPHNANNAGTELGNSNWVADLKMSLHTEDGDASYEDPNAIIYIEYSTKEDHHTVTDMLTYEYLTQNQWVKDVINGHGPDYLFSVEIAYQKPLDSDIGFDVDYFSKSIDATIDYCGSDSDFQINQSIITDKEICFAGVDEECGDSCSITIEYHPN